jgi:hypothetical protein
MLKKISGLVTGLVLAVLCTVSSWAAGLEMGVGPPEVEFDVSSDSTTKVDFYIVGFTGNAEVIPIDIPLKVDPMVFHVDATKEPQKITLTFYGDESLGPQVFKGRIGFRSMGEGSIGVQINVKATINHIAKPLIEIEEACHPEVAKSWTPGVARSR